MMYHRASMSDKITDSRGSQAGMASILVTMVTLVVISLIVLSFASISRREQSNTLEQQLSTQAFYAAETGINDARLVIKVALASGQNPTKPQCAIDPTGLSYPTGTQWLNPAHTVGYTCLLVDATPTSLTHNSVGDDPWTVPVMVSDPTKHIASIQIQWTPSNPPPPTASDPHPKPSTDCPGTLGSFNPASGGSANWGCGYGLLRMDIVPTSGSLSESGLAASQLSGYFEPLKSAGHSGTFPHSSPAIVAPDCGNVHTYATCTATINGLSGTAYTLRLASWYRASNITVTAFDNSGQPLPTTGQVVVDATGFAAGVLRRIEERIPTTAASPNTPAFALQTNTSICKRFTVTPTYFDIADNLPTSPASTTDNANPECVQTGPDGSP